MSGKVSTYFKNTAMPNQSNQLTVALVGRPNVGKSALFNRLASRQISIVHDQPGVTRDRIAAPCPLTDPACELIDTGGIGVIADEDFAATVTTEAQIAVATSDLILLIVDAREGLHPIDEEIALLLRKAGAKVQLIINKSDNVEQENGSSEFAKLGFGNGLSVSAAHGRNFGELVDLLSQELAPLAADLEEKEEEVARVGLKIAIVGRPNAGKSSLINAILKDERSIVSDIAGTTRDAVDIPYEREGERHTLIDTAGIRSRTKMDSAVEVFSAMRAERSIRRADLVLLVVDLAAGVSAQDRKIARLIQKEQKPCIIVGNKWDLYHPDAGRRDRLEEAEEHLRNELFFLHYAPFVCVSAREKQALGKIFETIRTVRKEANEQLGTGQLNRLLQNAVIKNPPATHKRLNKRLKVFYAAAAVNDGYLTIPVPEYIIFVNDKRLAAESYQSYLANSIRKEHPASGIPLKLSFRSRRNLKDRKR